jgi:hypothetical protein
VHDPCSIAAELLWVPDLLPSQGDDVLLSD